MVGKWIGQAGREWTALKCCLFTGVWSALFFWMKKEIVVLLGKSLFGLG